MKLKKFIIIAGNYGSGKTEISLNLALAAAREIWMADIPVTRWRKPPVPAQIDGWTQGYATSPFSGWASG